MKRPLVFAALLAACGILILSALDLPLTRTAREGSFLSEGERAAGTLKGRLSRISRTSGGGTALFIENGEFMRNGAEKEVPEKTGMVIAYADEEPAAPLGSTLLLRGELSLIPSPDNPGEFDQRAYYLAQNILLRFSVTEAAPLSSDAGYPLREAARQLRAKLSRGLSAVFDEEDAAVLKALLLGNRSGLSDETEALYEAAGIRHVLTVSGLHVTLISGAAMLASGWILSFLPWQRLPGRLGKRGFAAARGLITGFAVCFYTELAGCGLPLRRAACMVLLLQLAAASRRSYDLLSALGAAFLAVVLPCPYVLFQASFQLSFACVFVIGVIFPPLARLLYMETPLGKAFLLPAVLALFTLPLQLAHYYVFHPLGFLGNLLVVPLVMWILIFGLLAAALSGILLPAGLFLAGPAHLALRAVRMYCLLIRKLPFSTVIAGKPMLLQTAVYALLAGAILFLLIRRRKRREEAALTLMMTAGQPPVKRILRESRECVFLLIAAGWLLSAVFLIRPGRGALTVTSLYVGQGDCHVIQADGKAFLIDGGSSGGSPAGTKILPYLKHEGIRRLSFVMASHADEDHINGLAEVLCADGLRTEELVLSGWDRGSEKTAALEAAAAASKAAVRSVFEGDVLSLDGITFRILAPARRPEAEENDVSLVVLLQHQGFRALFTGDIGEDKEKELLLRYGGLLTELDLLKAAHHGSRFSSSEAFVQTVSPAFAVISCGRNNRYGHPHAETLDRFSACGCRVLRTDRCGAVRFSLSKDRISVITYRKENEDEDQIYHIAGPAGSVHPLRLRKDEGKYGRREACSGDERDRKQRIACGIRSPRKLCGPGDGILRRRGRTAGGRSLGRRLLL